jgi:transcriptional regulator with XRE-family HTH domain
MTLDEPLRGFGGSLRRLRENHGYSGKEFAAKMSIPASYLSELEKNRRPISEKYLSKIADALGISSNELYTELTTMAPCLESSEVEYHAVPFSLPRMADPPTYRPPATDFADLATHLVRRMPADTAWKLVADLTEKARLGDHSAITAARALLSILETFPPINQPPSAP